MMTKLTPRNLTKEELNELAMYLMNDDDDLMSDKAKEEINDSITLAFDLPSNKVYVLRVYFFDNSTHGNLDKIVEEYLINEDLSIEDASDFDVI